MSSGQENKKVSGEKLSPKVERGPSANLQTGALQSHQQVSGKSGFYGWPELVGTEFAACARLLRRSNGSLQVAQSVIVELTAKYESWSLDELLEAYICALQRMEPIALCVEIQEPNPINELIRAELVVIRERIEVWSKQNPQKPLDEDQEEGGFPW